jgi:bacteriocin biosynthesis cyclodehydratase domain-containing protein
MGTWSLLAAGAFGHAVANEIRATVPGTRPVSGPEEAGDTPVILSTWRESRETALALDGPAGPPWWLPVVYAHPVIRVGPVLGHDLPGCYGCLLARELALKKDERITHALWDHYDEDADAGLPGYLPHHVHVATSLARLLAADPDHGQRRLFTCHVLTSELREEPYWPLPSCPRAARTFAEEGRA